MGAGRYKHRITFYRIVKVSDGGLGTVDTAVDVVSAWAQVGPTSAQEVIEAMKVQQKVSHRIRMRYLPDITSALRVRFGTRHFRILSVINLAEDNRDLILRCEETS